MTDANGLYYMRARFYSPELRRFINQDILLGGIENGQSLNRFAYVLGNPIVYIDPLGLEVYLCKIPFLYSPNPIKHHWIKTDSKEAGMGPIKSNCWEDPMSDIPYDDVQICDHSKFTNDPEVVCYKQEYVDENKVNELLEIGVPLGRWSAWNNCQTFAASILDRASILESPGNDYGQSGSCASPECVWRMK